MENKSPNKQEKSKQPSLKPNNNTFIAPSNTTIVYNNEANDNDNKYYEGDNVISTFKKQETDGLVQTKRMITDLSELLTNFSTKVFEQQEITNIIYSDTQSALQNIKDGNKELLISVEYQKGRGLYIGGFFIILGLFLLFYDYTL